MRKTLLTLTGVALWQLAASAAAADIHVTILADEDNANPSGTNASTGCSFREALKSAFDRVDRPDCATPNPLGQPQKIVFDLGGTVVINGLVPRPGGGSPPQIRNGTMPDIQNEVIIDGTGQSVVLSCDAAPNGQRILHEAVSAAKLTLTAIGISNCTASGFGIGVWNDGGDLTLNTVTFTSVHSSSGGNGGAVYHGGGVLNANNVNFLNNTAQNDANTNDGSGNGGALYIANATAVSLVNATFTNNTAGGSGGAIYVTVSDSLGHLYAITNGTFTLNKANGNAAEAGGGAIWAQTDADVTDIFQIANSVFGDPTGLLGNTAPRGVGGAIVLSGGQIAYIDPNIPIGPSIGGIVASHFQGNSAGGAATANAQGGSGGAIYARGMLTVVQSSFIGNTSTNGAGGGLAFIQSSDTTVPQLSVVNTTFNGNSAAQAGGGIANISVPGAVDLRNVTLAGNGTAGNITAGNITVVGGGNFFNANGYAFSPAFSRVLIANTIFASPSQGTNCGGQRFVDNGPDLQFGDSSCVSVPPGTSRPVGTDSADAVSAMISGDPKLGSAAPAGVAANSVPALNAFVYVMKPNANQSAALNAGSNSICSSGPVLNYDATGVPTIRPYGDANCDLGAYEQTATTPVQLQSFSVD